MKPALVAVVAFICACWLWTRATRWAHRQPAVWSAEQYLREVRT